MRYDDPNEPTPEEDLGIDIDVEDDGNDSAPVDVAPEPVKEKPEVPEKAGPPEQVPYKRLQEVVKERNDARTREAEKDREIAELKARFEKQEPAKPDESLAEKIRAQHSALLRGDEEEAERLSLELETMREERATNAAMARIEAKAAKAANEAQEDDANVAAKALIDAHDVLNYESDKFDPELFEDFKALADRYASTMSVVEAFAKAEERLLGKPKPPAKGNSKAYENAQIAARIPPSLSGAGQSNANAGSTQFSAQSVRKLPDAVFREKSDDLDKLLGNA